MEQKLPACPVETTLMLISNRWKVLILRDLLTGVKRFGELRHAEEEEPTKARIDYCPERPPIAPKGYRFVRVEYNRYGYMCFHYVRDRRGRGRTKKE